LAKRWPISPKIEFSASFETRVTIYRTIVKIKGYSFSYNPNDQFDLVIRPGLDAASGCYYRISPTVKVKLAIHYQFFYCGKLTGGFGRVGNQMQKLQYPYDYDENSWSAVTFELGIVYSL